MTMELHPAIAQHYPFLNEDQLAAVSQTDGPLLIIAGPGAGKTLVLVVRTLNILLLEKAQPEEIILCTFTEKAAFELRDRVAQGARKVGYRGDLSRLKVNTIHGVCNEYLAKYRHHTDLGAGYEVLDELTQSLFLFENFAHIAGEAGTNELYLGKWKTRWTTIEGLKGFFNKITEELVDGEGLQTSPDPFLRQLGPAYQRYEQTMRDRNRMDFAHQQKHFYDLLQRPEIAHDVQSHIRYVMVDEYQDTNYIQERLILLLAHPGNNLAVVGEAIYQSRSPGRRRYTVLHRPLVIVPAATIDIP